MLNIRAAVRKKSRIISAFLSRLGEPIHDTLDTKIEHSKVVATLKNYEEKIDFNEANRIKNANFRILLRQT